MRALVTLGAAALITTGGVTGVAEAAGTGAVTCARVDPYTGECLITATLPGSSTRVIDEGAAPTAQSGGPASACFYDHGQREVPCRTGAGYWSAERQCRISVVQPPPPLDEGVWAGETQHGIYRCSLDQPAGDAVTDYIFWEEVAPPGAEAPVDPPAPVDPAALAQEAVAAMGLQAIDIGIAPQAAPGSVGLVGLPVWMWAAQPTAVTVGPVTETATAGGVSVTATATIERIDWTMGDGTTVTCIGPGAPYDDAFGDQDSPDCGHRYQQASTGLPGDAYTIEATSYWTIDWAGSGAEGQIPLTVIAEEQIQVGELQVLVTG